MFFKYFYSKEIYIKWCVKIAEKWKNDKFSKKDFFMNFQDMIIWFDLGENTSLGSILKKISYSQNAYCRKAPSFCPHRRKKAFLRDFFNFRPNFHVLGQQVKPIISKGHSSGYFELFSLLIFFSLQFKRYDHVVGT